MEENYEKQGAVIVRNCPDIFLPIRGAIIRILKLRFPDMPFDKWPDEIGAFSKWIGETYRDHREKILHVYDVLDRSLEIQEAGCHPLIQQALKEKVGMIQPILANYPTWRMDTFYDPTSRTFPWHQETYHEKFSENACAVWAPLIPVSPNLPSNTLWIKERGHTYGRLQCGENKFNIIDPRLEEFPEKGLELNFGDFVVFSNLIPHRSGPIANSNTIRLSLQFRYDDLCDPHYLSMGWPSNAVQPDIHQGQYS